MFYWEKPIDAAYSGLLERIESNHKALKFKVGNTVRPTSHENIFRKGNNINWLRKIFVINSVLKANSWTYETKDLNGKKTI